MKMGKRFLDYNLQFFADAAAGNSQIIKGTVSTGGDYGTSGLLAPKDAEAFLTMLKDDSTFLSRMSSENVDRKEGTISKLGVGSRLLRRHTEGEDGITGKEVAPVIGSVKYKCEYSCLGTSITEEWIEQNKARQNFESLFMGEIAKQIKVDILDLAFNGDEDIAASNPDHDFLCLDNGFIKQIRAGGNVVDGATIAGGKFSKSIFYALRKAVPKKYRNSNFKWICSDDTYTDLCEYLSDRPTSLGDITIVKGENVQILETTFERIPNFPDDVIIYADPKNLELIYFLQISHRKTTEGKEAIYQRKRFYATHLATDAIIKEIKATAILINRGALATEGE